jgi:hypothetical protein
LTGREWQIDGAEAGGKSPAFRRGDGLLDDFGALVDGAAAPELMLPWQADACRAGDIALAATATE